MGKIRVGIVGVGTIAKEAHLPSYIKRDDVEIVAFVDPEVDRARETAAKLAATTGRPEPKVYPSLEACLATEQLDAVSICTPNTSHISLALLALDAGLHVLVEKPMGTSLEEANALAEKVRATGKVLMVGMTHRYRDDASVLKRVVESGELGDIYYAKTRILRRRGTPKGWFTNYEISGGGPLMDIGVHALDLTWWLLGNPTVASVNGFLHKGIGNDQLDFVNTWTASSSGNQNNEIYTTEDFASAFLRFQNGSVLQMEVSWSLNGPQDDALKVEIFGSKGGVSLDPLRVYSTSHNVLSSTELSVKMGRFYDTEIGHFIECVKTGATPISDVIQGRDIVQMLTAITESSQAKKEITL